MNPMDTARGWVRLLNLKGYKVPPGGTYHDGEALEDGKNLCARHTDNEK